MNEPSLPDWAKTLQRRIRQRGIDFFILHGPGVRDLHPLGARRFGTIGDCLAQVILNDRSAIVTYDRGAGIGFTDRDVENDFKTVLKAYDKLGGTNLAQVQPRDPDRALQLIETYLRYQLSGNPRFSAAVIIDYGETVAPAGEPGQLPAEDRSAIVTLRRWACEPLFLQRSVTFCLLVETTGTLSAALVADARTFEIAVPVPDEQERYAYLAGRGSRPETFAAVDARRVAILTAGLTRLHLESLLAESEANGAPLDQDALTREKKRLIEEASGGLLTFMTSRVGLDAVAGHEGAKALLRETARALSQGRLDVVPMGYLICGPVGTGKSFIVQCFAKEIGIPVVELLNFRCERLGIGLEPGVDAAALLGESHDALSAADLEAILVRGSRRMAAGGQKILSAALLRELIKDFQPPSYPLELEYQRLIAAFECTSRRLLPPDLAALSAEAIGTRLAELRSALAATGR